MTLYVLPRENILTSRTIIQQTFTCARLQEIKRYLNTGNMDEFENSTAKRHRPSLAALGFRMCSQQGNIYRENTFFMNIHLENSIKIATDSKLSYMLQNIQHVKMGRFACIEST
jgi:hypothetical protein